MKNLIVTREEIRENLKKLQGKFFALRDSL